MYYKDLTKYSYQKDMLKYVDNEVLNIGWLDYTQDYIKGSPSNEFLEKLFTLCQNSVLKMRGNHICSFCGEGFKEIVTAEHKGGVAYLGHSEIWIKGSNDVIYAAPTLVYHYIIEHSYLPPDEFVEAVLHGEPVNPEPKYTDYKEPFWSKLKRILSLR